MGRGPRTPPMLEVRPMFEPTRLAVACLESAYARIVPTPWRRTRVQRQLAVPTMLPTGSGIATAEPRDVMPRTREVRHG